ncbi:MAG: hypothetical protein ACFFG0_10410 [Candidatus Thorarchaeota archaeon]
MTPGNKFFHIAFFFVICTFISVQLIKSEVLTAICLGCAFISAFFSCFKD